MRTLASGSLDGQIILFGDNSNSGNDDVEEDNNDGLASLCKMQYMQQLQE